MSELRAGGYESLYQYDEKQEERRCKGWSHSAGCSRRRCGRRHHKRHALLRRFRKPRGSRQGGSFCSAGIFRRCRALEQPLGYRVRPESGSVYSAFYSEEEITSGDASTTLPTYLNRMRVRQTRLHNGAKIGYYGGARVISGTTDTLKRTSPSITARS